MERIIQLAPHSRSLHCLVNAYPWQITYCVCMHIDDKSSVLPAVNPRRSKDSLDTSLCMPLTSVEE